MAAAARRAPIHVAIDTRRRVVAPDGVVVHRMLDLPGRVHGSLQPPRVRYDDALLDVALEQRSRLAVVATLGDRTWIESVLADIGAGTCSTLEHGYLTGVERPHHLPPAHRQVREVTHTGVVWRDAVYDELVIELDGRLFHDDVSSRAHDLDRDLVTATTGRRTVRLGWGQVYGTPCRTALAIATILRAAGRAVEPRPCSPHCAVRVITEDSGHWVA